MKMSMLLRKNAELVLFESISCYSVIIVVVIISGKWFHRVVVIIFGIFPFIMRTEFSEKLFLTLCQAHVRT